MKRLIVASMLMLFVGLSHAVINRDGVLGVNRTHSAKTLGHSKMSVGLLTRITNDKSIFSNTLQRPTEPLGASWTTYQPSEFWGFSAFPFLGIGFGRFVDLSVVMPLHYDYLKTEQGVPPNANPLIGTQAWSPGDVKAQFKLRLPLPQEDNIVDVAVLAGMQFGTSNPERRTMWAREIENIVPNGNDAGEIHSFGTGKQVLTGGLLLTLDFLRLDNSVPLEWNFNLVYRAPMEVYTSVVAMGSSLEFSPVEFLSFFAEIYHERPELPVTSVSPMDVSLQSDNINPTYFTLGGAIRTGVGLDFVGGLTFGVARDGVIYGNTEVQDNENSIITNPVPGLTAIFGITWNGFLMAQDDDKDGIVNKEDQCPKSPEDFDGFQDDNGCPDLDNDGDAINDVLDECPNKREDFDSFEDEDGCPDLDNDKDGNPDKTDKCPLDPEDKDGFEDGDGCPDGDNDKDGILDEDDKCPLKAEDIDTFEDEDGCPDPDNDRDGILDARDKCPLQPETVNTYQDGDGCPDKKPVEKPKEKPIAKTVTLKGVNFKTGTADLTFEAREILQPVVRQLKAYPKVEIEIRGHTDSRGKNSSNQRLSKRRARAVVEFLVEQGIGSNRVKAIGMGEDQPIASNRTAAGRAKNRRIEMYRTK